jgi:NADH pyrophosphatase NudC (nudix superfamily)
METDNWQPKAMWCPHCGHKKEYNTEIDYKMMRQ